MLSPSVTARSLSCLSLDRGFIWELGPISEMQFAIRSVGDLPRRAQNPRTGTPQATVSDGSSPGPAWQSRQAECKPSFGTVHVFQVLSRGEPASE